MVLKDERDLRDTNIADKSVIKAIGDGPYLMVQEYIRGHGIRILLYGFIDVVGPIVISRR